MNIDFLREQKDLLAHQQSFSDGFVLPDYDKLNTKNISSMIGSVFSINSLRKAMVPEGYLDDCSGIEKVLLIILDGLGFNRLLTYLGNHEGAFSEIAQKGILKPLTTTFPSTTATVLTSIFTGVSPAEHNIVGYQMFSKDYGLVFNTLDMKPVFGYSSHVDLVDIFSKKVKPWLPVLEEYDVMPLVITKAGIVGSGLSRIIHRNQTIISYQLQSDMFVQCKNALELPNRSLIVMYYAGIDTLEHRYGPYSEEVTFEMHALESNFKNFIDSLLAETKKNTMLILTSDHGVAETSKFHFIKDFPEINNRLMLPPVGDSRATFLFSKPDQKEGLSAAFKNSIPDMKLFSSDELIQKGAFGQATNMHPLKENVGDFAALSTDHSALQYPFYEDDRYHQQLGAHGGMTAEEMIVPFLSIRLSKV